MARSAIQYVAASRSGTIDPATGKITFADSPSAHTYDLPDELVGLTVRAGGEVPPHQEHGLAQWQSGCRDLPMSRVRLPV